jgi:hypothetical protein
VNRAEGKRLFVRALAEFLAGDQARKSIELEMGRPHALEWAALRHRSSLSGYPTVDEAERALTEFLE